MGVHNKLLNNDSELVLIRDLVEVKLNHAYIEPSLSMGCRGQKGV